MVQTMDGKQLVGSDAHHECETTLAQIKMMVLDENDRKCGDEAIQNPCDDGVSNSTKREAMRVRTICESEIAVPTDDNGFTEAENEWTNHRHHDNVVHSHMLRINLSLRLQMLVSGQSSQP